MIASRSIPLILGKLQTKFADKIKTLFFIRSILFSKNISVYEIMWKNMAQPEWL